MPRIRRNSRVSPQSLSSDLTDRLVQELRSDRSWGQPVIDEQRFPSGKLRVTVLWDAWDRLPLEERTAVILRAYEIAEESAVRENIALASGLTFPEAYATGMLPFRVFPALRKSDPVTEEECREAMIKEGASVLLDSEQPQLRFSTAEEADAAVSRLAECLPGSDDVWWVTREVGKVEDWALR